MRKIAVEKAAKLLSGNGNIVAAWLFGSSKGGRARDGADLDIGVFFESMPGLDELACLRADLQTALNFDQIDLVVLNGSSAVLRFEAASGRLLYSGDDQRRAGFVSLAAREYEDEMALARRHLAAR